VADYRRVIIDLSLQADRLPIDGIQGGAFRNQFIDFLTVIAAPAASGIALHFGQGGEFWDLPPEGTTFEFCPPENGGIYYSLASPGAGSVVLIVSFTGVGQGA
jgi:hypothetical protein